MEIKKILLLGLVMLLILPFGTVSAVEYDVRKTIETKTILKSQEEIEKEFQKETEKYIKELKEQEITPNSRAEYVSETVARNTKWTGLNKAGGQHLGPVSFPDYGGTIYWEPSSGPKASGSISVSGKIIGFSVSIGSRKSSGVTGYGVNVPDHGSWYLYVNRKVEGRKINIYRIYNGKKTLYHVQYATKAVGQSFRVKES